MRVYHLGVVICLRYIESTSTTVENSMKLQLSKCAEMVRERNQRDEDRGVALGLQEKLKRQGSARRALQERREMLESMAEHREEYLM